MFKISSERFTELGFYLNDNHFVQSLQENTDYQAIFRHASALLAQGRWYDLVHTIIAVGHMAQIIEGERAEGLLRSVTEEQYREYKAVLLPAIMLHDIGWSAIGAEKNTEWDNQALRTLHMEIGAKLAQSILDTIAYSPTITQRIVHLVAHHDDQYLGLNPQTTEEFLLRDADACFILTFLSFWKDFTVKGKELTPHEFLIMKEKKWGTRYSRTAQRISDREFEMRKNEVNNIEVSLNRFDHLKKTIEIYNKQVLEQY